MNGKKIIGFVTLVIILAGLSLALRPTVPPVSGAGLYVDFPRLRCAHAISTYQLSPDASLPAASEAIVYRVVQPSRALALLDKVEGGIRLGAGSGGYVPPNVTEQPVLPDEAQAKEMALDYLARRRLLPDDFGPVTVKAGSSQAEYSKGTGQQSYKFITSLHIVLGREIDGVPVAGPRNTLRVTIGDGPEVVAVRKLWPDVRPGETVPLRPIGQAMEDLRQGRHSGIHPRSHSGAVAALVEKAELNYWVGESPQEYAMPVYAMSGVYLDADGQEVDTFTVWVNASA